MWVINRVLKGGDKFSKSMPIFQFLRLYLRIFSCVGLACNELMLAKHVKVTRRLIFSRFPYLFATLFVLSVVTPGMASTSEAEKAYDSGDYFEALELWLPLAEAGDTTAQYNVATLYRLGRGVPADPVVSVDWYLRAALNGHVRSQVSLGRMYLEGAGVERDVPQALPGPNPPTDITRAEPL